METHHLVHTLRAIINHWKQQQHTIALVPTMGCLHQGHLALVDAAKQQANKVIVSIFVNPTQFVAGEDFEHYPRMEQRDKQALIAHEIDLLFLPSNQELYHPSAKTMITVMGLSDLHCGKTRRGHFSGVTTIVAKLLNIVQPDHLFLGEKDFQQLTIIRLMVRDLNIPVNVESVKTIRENDGLAMSSRNQYLTTAQRQIAPKLYQALHYARERVMEKRYSFIEIEQQQKQVLTEAGFQVDYFSICRSNDLLAANEDDRQLIILAAAHLGKPRLIDNILIR
jgi:pantoate--beta-alanine ligase